MSTEIAEVEMNIKEAQKMVELGKSLERLRNNRDFKKLILDDYLEKEAVRLVHLKSDSNTQDERSQASIMRDIDAVGSFTQYLNLIVYKADSAKQGIAEAEETLDELRNEGVEE